MQTVNVGGGVLAGFALFRRLFPTRLEPLPPGEMERLSKVYTKWNLFAALLLFAYIVPITAGWFYALAPIAAPALPGAPGEIRLVPPSVSMLIPAFFLAIITAALPMAPTFRLLLGRRFEEYRRWDELRVGFVGRPPFAILATSLVLLCLPYFAVIRNTGTDFLADRIVVRGPLSTEPTIYPYARVRAIARVAKSRAPIGTVNDRKHIAIRFDDGYTWATGNRLDNKQIGEDREREILDLVSRRTGLAPRQVDLVEDLEP